VTSQVFIILDLNGILLDLVYCERPLNHIPLRILVPFDYVGSILSILGKFLTVLFNLDVRIASLDHDGNRRNQDAPLTGRHCL